MPLTPLSCSSWCADGGDRHRHLPGYVLGALFRRNDDLCELIGCGCLVLCAAPALSIGMVNATSPAPWETRRSGPIE